MARLAGAWVLSLAVLISGCGGGGGSSKSGAASSASAATSFGPVARAYGDTWTRNTISVTNAGSTSSATTIHSVDGVNADSSFAVGVTNSSLLPTDSATLAADGSTLQGGGCIYSPSQQIYSFPLSVGKSWNINYTYACDGAPTLTYTGTANVVDRETLSIPAGSWDTLKITYSLTATGNPSTTQTGNTTCWWAIAIGINVQCQTSYTYSGTVVATDNVSSSFVVTNYQASSGPKPAPASNTYPAFSPAVPIVAKQTLGGSALTSPRPVPVFFQDSPDQTALADFMSKFSAATYWTTLAQYGVGAPQIGTPATLATTAPVVITEDQIKTWLIAQLQTTPSSFGVLDANSYFVLYYPSTTTIKDASGTVVSCSKLQGYHNYVHLSGGLNVPYAVVVDCQRGLETLTTVASHELFEGSADPYLNNYNTINGDIGWAAAYDDSELGDMCEHMYANSWTVPLSLGYRVATVWSNALASTFQDPCAPASSLREISAYFQSVPVLPDTVSITNINNFSGSAKGVKIPVGTSRTINVQLVSNQAMPGIWRVDARQAGLQSGAASTLTFSWDKMYGQNGDVLHLTITPTAPLPDGAVFEVESYYGGSRRNWVGAVSN